MNSERPFVLSIAGFDPSGGAGLSADGKVFELLKVQGMSVCTAITFQNESEFEGVRWVEIEDIKSQLSVLFKKYTFDYVKIGLIESLDVLEQVVDFILKRNNKVKIIWDPILKASAGFGFHSDLKAEQVKNICSKLYLVTPNSKEVMELLQNENSPEEKALELSSICMVMLKGGHDAKNIAEDILVINGIKHSFIGDRIIKGEKHGSGCVLSSSLVSYLALGLSIEKACEKAKQYTAKYLSSSEGLLGYHLN